MDICLISKDEKLSRSFRDVTRGMPQVRFERVAGAEERPAADLYVWDFTASGETANGVDFGDEVDNAFLVRPEDMALFQERLQFAAVSVLVKPAGRAELERFLQRAFARWVWARTAASGRRQERDDFVECLLLASLKVQQYTTERANFVTRALQDLWAPLTAADGYCAVLAGEAVGTLNSDQVGVLLRLQTSIRHLRRIAELLVQLGMDPARGEPPSLVCGDIVAGLRRAVDTVLPSAEAKNLELTTDVQRPPQPLYFDRAQIEQVIVELLENAFRFTPRGGSVELKAYPISSPMRKFRLRSAAGTWFRPAPVAEGPNAYRVDVVDSGPAIPMENLAGVFDHYRPYSGKEDRSGTGLGLARCRMVVSAHCGEMFAEHQTAGATFSFILPFARPETTEANCITASEGDGAGALQDDYKNNIAGGGSN
jgi:signal transduction histidine kinase